MRSVVLTVISLALLGGSAHSADLLIERQIEGPWECSVEDGIHGLFVSYTGLEAMIRVYHRQNGKERWGYFSMLAPDTPTATKSFDDRHLSIEFKGHTDIEPFSIYLAFDEPSQTWKGTWSACNKVPGDAVLSRPYFVRSTNVMVGDWNSRPNPNGKFYTAGSLHFRQSSDGLLIAWMDRVFAPGRNGEQLKVITAQQGHVELETQSGFGATFTFGGTISSDGKQLSGTWYVRGSPGMSLQAPDLFDREN